MTGPLGTNEHRSRVLTISQDLIGSRVGWPWAALLGARCLGRGL
mgnify:CR=1 FL=1